MMYRGFYAIPSLSTKAGQPTNAVFGFIRMSEQLFRDWNPTHVVVTFDGGTPRERLDLLASYKANRKPMPEALRSQIPIVARYLEAAGICSERIEGQEADDVMATLAFKAKGAFARVLVATGDKDMYQVVDDTVNIVPQSGRPEAMGTQEVIAKTGVRPEQVPDWLALVGDTSDNIPGVPGIGAKTAAKLLEEFGDLDALLADVSRLPSPRLRSAIEDSREAIARNRRMVKLRIDVPCDFPWEKAVLRPRTGHGLRALLEELEFHSMVKALEQPTLDL